MADPIYALVQGGKVHQIGVPAFFKDIPNIVVIRVSSVVGVAEGWLVDDNGDVTAPLAPLMDFRAYAAAARFDKETAGITVGNAPIATDRDSQAMITGMWATAQMNPAVSVQFKSAGGGFATINAAQIQSIAAAVSAHIQACFAAEGQVDAAITAGTITTTAQIDQAFAAITV